MSEIDLRPTSWFYRCRWCNNIFFTCSAVFVDVAKAAVARQNIVEQTATHQCYRDAPDHTGVGDLVGVRATKDYELEST